MPAAIKLALPLLRSASPWWFWLLMVIWATLARITDDAQLGSAISVGGAMLLMLGMALGMNLRLCKNRSLAAVLPGFDRSGPLAAGGILLGLVAALAGLDAWRLDSLLALITASALGLGIGLCLPPAGFPILIALLFFALGWGATGLNIIWTGSWSALIATGLLAIGLTLHQSRSPRWLIRLDRSDGAWVQASARDRKSRGRDPYRSGHLFSPWRAALTQLGIGLGLGLLAITSLDEGSKLLPTDPDPTGALVYFLTLFAGAGVLSLLFGLLMTGQATLRKLAVLPGWHREALFHHAERSCLRCALAALMTLGAALVLISLWIGELNHEQLLAAVGFVGGLYLVGTYMALWLMRLRSQLVALIALSTLLCPFFSIGWWMFSDIRDQLPTAHGASAGFSAMTGLLAVAGFAVLIGWLRRSARRAWRSIDFPRRA